MMLTFIEETVVMTCDVALQMLSVDNQEPHMGELEQTATAMSLLNSVAYSLLLVLMSRIIHQRKHSMIHVYLLFLCVTELAQQSMFAVSSVGQRWLYFGYERVDVAHRTAQTLGVAFTSEAWMRAAVTALEVANIAEMVAAGVRVWWLAIISHARCRQVHYASSPSDRATPGIAKRRIPLLDIALFTAISVTLTVLIVVASLVIFRLPPTPVVCIDFNNNLTLPSAESELRHIRFLTLDRSGRNASIGENLSVTLFSVLYTAVQFCCPFVIIFVTSMITWKSVIAYSLNRPRRYPLRRIHLTMLAIVTSFFVLELPSFLNNAVYGPLEHLHGIGQGSVSCTKSDNGPTLILVATVSDLLSCFHSSLIVLLYLVGDPVLRRAIRVHIIERVQCCGIKQSNDVKPCVNKAVDVISSNCGPATFHRTCTEAPSLGLPLVPQLQEPRSIDNEISLHTPLVFVYETPDKRERETFV